MTCPLKIAHKIASLTYWTIEGGFLFEPLIPLTYLTCFPDVAKSGAFNDDKGFKKH